MCISDKRWTKSLHIPGMSDLGPKCVRMAPNCSEIWSENAPDLSQSNHLKPNLTSLAYITDSRLPRTSYAATCSLVRTILSALSYLGPNSAKLV